MKKMSFLCFAVAGIMFLTTQSGVAQDDVFDFFNTANVPVAEVDDGLADLFPTDALADDGEVAYELPQADIAAITGEGLVEETDEALLPVNEVPKASPILSAAPKEAKGTTVPVLPPPAVPKSALQHPTLPAPSLPQPAPMTVAVHPQPQPQPQPAAGYCQDCQDCNSPGLFQGRCRGLFAGRQARVAPARPEPREARGGNFRQPMVDPYYTLRGPRHFDDPNPRPIGR